MPSTIRRGHPRRNKDGTFTQVRTHPIKTSGYVKKRRRDGSVGVFDTAAMERTMKESSEHPPKKNPRLQKNLDSMYEEIRRRKTKEKQ